MRQAKSEGHRHHRAQRHAPWKPSLRPLVKVGSGTPFSGEGGGKGGLEKAVLCEKYEIERQTACELAR